MKGRTIGPERCVLIVRGITSASDRERHSWGGTPGLWDSWGDLDDHETRTVAAVLGWAALIEPAGSDIREHFLDSLASLATSWLVDTATMEQVLAGIPPEDLTVPEIDFYEGIVDELRDQHARTGPAPRDAVRRPVGPARCVQLLRGITTESRQERYDTAPLAGGWIAAGELDTLEAGTIAAVLTWAAVLETADPAIRVRQFASIQAVAERDRLPAAVHDQINGINDLHPDEHDARAALVTALQAPC